MSAAQSGPHFLARTTATSSRPSTATSAHHVNLRGAEGRAVLHDLVARRTGVLDNLRGDHPPRLGTTYEAAEDANPRIVCAHLSAFGREGNRANWPGYDYLMQAEAGYLSLTGEPDRPPRALACRSST